MSVETLKTMQANSVGRAVEYKSEDSGFNSLLVHITCLVIGHKIISPDIVSLVTGTSMCT